MMNNIDGTDFYQSLRIKVREYLKTQDGKNNKFVEYILLAPDLFHLLCKLTIDKDVNVSDKAKLGIAIAYFVSPIDLIPEGLFGPLGLVDDIGIAAFVLSGIINNTDPDVIKRNWAGEGDVLEIIQQVLKIADEMIGSGVWSKIKSMFGK